jgi:hypothetical protein
MNFGRLCEHSGPILKSVVTTIVRLPENCDDDDELKAISDVLDMCCSASCQ